MDEVKLIPINLILPDKNQPRKKFNEDKLRELAESIKQHGLLEPIIVTPLKNGKYQLVCGERRLRACKLAGLTTVLADIKQLSEEQILEVQLTENLQRENLNPIEEAETYQRMINELGYTHEKLAQKIGKSREYVTNKLRLLKLPKETINALQEGKISESHARLLSSLDKKQQNETLKEVVDNQLSVRGLKASIETSGDVSRETLEASNDKKTLLPISFKVYQLLKQFSRRVKSKPEVLANKAIMNLIQEEGD